MNMIKATAGKGDFSSSLGKIAPKTKLKSVQLGEAALLGIRPSDIRFAEKGEIALKSKITMLEPLGDVTVVSVEAAGEALRMLVPESKATSIRPGQTASIFIDPKKFHIFRASNGQVFT